MPIAQADGQKKTRPVLLLRERLVKPSVVRLSFLAIVRRTEVMGRLGTISLDRHQRLLSNLANCLRL